MVGAPTPPTRFKVGLVQMRMTADPAANLATAVARVKEAAAKGAAIVCLPELFRTLYLAQREDHELFNLAEAVPGPSTQALGKEARDLGIVVIAGAIMSFAAYCFFVSGLAFLARMIELWVLIIFSPFAFMSFAVPKLSGTEYIGWDDWFKRLMKGRFMAPVFMFLFS